MSSLRVMVKRNRAKKATERDSKTEERYCDRKHFIYRF